MFGQPLATAWELLPVEVCKAALAMRACTAGFAVEACNTATAVEACKATSVVGGCKAVFAEISQWRFAATTLLALVAS